MSLGKVSIAIEAAMASFESDMGRAARVLEKESKRMEKHAKSAGQAIDRSFAVGASIAAAGMAVYIKNTIEAEKVQSQLMSRLKDTAGIAERSLSELNAAAERMQSQTIFDDEAIGSVQAMLLTFKQIRGVRFDEATAAVLDMSTAMGSDAVTAATQLGKALNDPIKGVSALSKIGIQFAEDQRKLIKALVETGDMAGAQKLILDELEGQMGTAAEAARGTLGGALTALKNSFGNLLEGDSGSDGMIGARDAVESLNRTLNDPGIKAGVDSIVEGMFRIANGAIRIVSAVGNAGSALTEFFGSNQKKGDASLVNRKNELETELFKAQRRSGQGLSDANDPISKMLGLPSGRDEKIKQLKAEIAEIEALQKARAKALMFDGVIGNYQNTIGTEMRAPSGGGKATSSKATKTGKDRDLPNFAKDAADEVRKLIEAEDKARESFEAMAASLAGPMADANYRFIQDQERLNELAKEGAIAVPELAKAQDDLRAVHEKNVEIINAQLEPHEEVLAGLEEEIKLLGMSTEAQERYNLLKRAGVSIESEFGRQIDATARQMQEARKAGAVMEELHDIGVDFFTDLMDYTKSSEDAFRSFADSIRQMMIRLLAEALMKKIIDMLKGDENAGDGGCSGGGGGSGNAGGWGAFFGAVVGALGSNRSGGARATGGPTQRGMFYEVNERAPELYSEGGRTFLMAGSRNGHVTPMAQASNSAQPVNVKVVAVYSEEDAQRMVLDTMKGPKGERVSVVHFQRNRKVLR